MPKINWNNNLPITKGAFHHHVQNGNVIFDSLTQQTIVIIDGQYHIYHKGKWLGPYETHREAQFWIRTLN